MSGASNEAAHLAADREAGPFIAADQKLPEITPKAVILAAILTIILATANAYLGLKVGVTVAASIPAAVISMGVLRLFRKSNILENNIVQTAASAGEGLISAIAYVLPALLILKYWQQFNYWETMLIAMIGGFLGILFSVPLRRVLLAHKQLRFPEGTAIGHVLKASVEGKKGLQQLVRGGLVGGIISLAQSGFQFIADSMQFWFKAGDSFIYGLGLGFEPALIAAGYIVGVTVALSSLLGVILGWVIGIPVLSHLYLASHLSAVDPNDAAMHIWHDQIRYIGVGTMLVGGMWTLIILAKPIYNGLRSSFSSIHNLNTGKPVQVLRTDRDIPIQYIMIALIVLLLPLGSLLYHFITCSMLKIGPGLQLSTLAITLVFIICAGFIFSAISGYFVGLVGSTNSPVSGLFLSSLLLISLVLFALFGTAISFTIDTVQRLAAAGFAISITAIVGAATVITNETIQDLKAGHMVGATPWKQQVMLMIGVAVASLVIPPVMQLLFDAYGIGGVFPRPGMDPSHMLAAPQAGLMAALAQGVFTHNLPWTLIGAGALIAVVCIIIDRYLHTKNMSLPVLAVGLGIYLPLGASVPMIIGGLASYFIERGVRRRLMVANGSIDNGKLRFARQRGLILACGVVAGAALMGVILAVPFAIAESTDVLKLVPDGFTSIANCLGILMTLGLIYWFYHVVCKTES